MNRILFTSSDIDSYKLKGVLDAFEIPYLSVPESEVNEKIRASNYQQGPILYTESKTMEIFWNIIHYFDSTLWNRELQLSNPEDKEMLMKAFERCDRQFFPALFRDVVSNSSSPKRNASKLTEILNWKTLSKNKQERSSFAIECKSNGVADLDSPTALNGVISLLEETELPELHHKVLKASITGALDGLRSLG